MGHCACVRQYEVIEIDALSFTPRYNATELIEIDVFTGEKNVFLFSVIKVY